MRFTKGTFPRLLTGLSVSEVPYNTAVNGESDDVTVGLAQVNLYIPSASAHAYWIELKNISAAGQQIRVASTAPNFAPGAGILLYPGDALTLENFSITLFAIANLAGGIISKSVWRKT